MKEGLWLQEPQRFGDRTIIPVVCGTSVSHAGGMAGAIRPVALLIGEGDTWGIALLEGDSVLAVIEDLVLPG